MQCGGMLGLQQALLAEPPDGEIVEDINGLLENAIEDYGTVDNLPYGEVVKGITSFLPRAKR